MLEELFRLDHLATRIRRNAESLLVLSGDDLARRWGKPVPLADVVRAAAAEVEDYRRVEVLVNDHLEVTGRAVADLAHLLAELIENATTFSPPTSEVRVRSHLTPGESGAIVVSIEDSGIGMLEDELTRANALLAEAPEVDLGRSTMLGFHVVARLAKRYGLRVRLAPTPGGASRRWSPWSASWSASARPARSARRGGCPGTAPTATSSPPSRAATVTRGAGPRGSTRRPRAAAPDQPPAPAPPEVERPRPSELVSPWREIPIPAPTTPAPDGDAEADPFASVVARWRQAEMEAAQADQQAGTTADGAAAPERPALLPAPVPELPPSRHPTGGGSPSRWYRAGDGATAGNGAPEPPSAPASAPHRRPAEPHAPSCRRSPTGWCGGSPGRTSPPPCAGTARPTRRRPPPRR